MIGLINLEVKCAGARSAGNPHAACDVAGVGNGATDDSTWGTMEETPDTDKGLPKWATAPALDPTTFISSILTRKLLRSDEFGLS